MVRHSIFAVALCAATVASPAETGAVKPPHLVGAYYLDARQQLRKLGYAPVTMTRHPEALCLDRRCTKTKKVTEGFCASDVPSCVFFWRAPSGRYIRVDTQGEWRVKVTGVIWASPSEVQGQKVD